MTGFWERRSEVETGEWMRYSDRDRVICELSDGGAHPAAHERPFADDLDSPGSVVRLCFRRPGRAHPAAGSVNS